MALATYLQEGTPCEFKQGTLTVCFTKENTFAKESLDRKENVKFIEGVFSEKLNASIIVNFKIADKLAPVIKQEEAVVKSALEMFGGKVVKEWPNGQK
jgi:hypothetical protein